MGADARVYPSWLAQWRRAPIRERQGRRCVVWRPVDDVTQMQSRAERAVSHLRRARMRGNEVRRIAPSRTPSRSSRARDARKRRNH